MAHKYEAEKNEITNFFYMTYSEILILILLHVCA